jgi:threonine synthase
MRYISTRSSEKSQTLSFAMNQGLASDGGLFIPEKMPNVDISNFPSELSYPEFCTKILSLFFAGDVLEGSLPSFCERAFDFPVPVKQLDKNSFVLELFHGPTSSFKDFGAKFLAECLNSLASQMKTIMVATSGDTGSAVASAFYKKSNYRAVILYPEGKISKKQAHQITCWDQNVFAFAVKGTFDDCQKLVKDAFNDPRWQAAGGLSSANSINIGRLLPQITYYAYTSLQLYRQHHLKPGFIIPTGNLGNATAAYWAKAMGFPIRDIVLATNANRVILDYLQTHHYQPRRSIETIANAMDVGNPSNFERLQYLLGTFKNFEKEVHAISVDDDKIRETIKETYQHYHYISCPHTATALFARKQLDDQLWVSVATADPCKFDDVIEPILNIKIPVAPQLQKLLDKPTRVFQVEANLDKIHEKLLTL